MAELVENMNSYDKRVLDLSLKAGSVLLECGAEISRVEETIRRIGKSYGVSSTSPFILSNGVFLTAENELRQMYAMVKHIPLSTVQLNKVDAVNQLSREIEEGRYTLEEAEAKLEAICHMPGKREITRILASGVGAACFCYVIGGGIMDCMASFVAGFFLYVFLIALGHREKHTSKLLVNLAGAFLATGIGMLFYHLGVGSHYNRIVVGAIMPLLPGVPFVNSIRDFANGDYMSGTIRLIDALMVTFGIALGVGAFFILYGKLGGVMVL